VGLTGDEAGFSILVEPEGLTVEVATRSARRKIEIENGLSLIEGVRANVLGPDQLNQAASNEAPVLTGSVRHIVPERLSQPLFWNYLVARLGSAETARDYSSQILTAAGKTRSLAAQLFGLGSRYPLDVCQSISGDAQTKVKSLAGKMIQSLAQSVDDYGGILAKAFDRPVNLPRASLNSNWQSRASRLFAVVSERDRLMARLFAVTERENNATITEEQAVQDFFTVNQRIAGLAAEPAP